MKRCFGWNTGKDMKLPCALQDVFSYPEALQIPSFCVFLEPWLDTMIEAQAVL
jgi:hypothetical protein